MNGPCLIAFLQEWADVITGSVNRDLQPAGRDSENLMLKTVENIIIDFPISGALVSLVFVRQNLVRLTWLCTQCSLHCVLLNCTTQTNL